MAAAADGPLILFKSNQAQSRPSQTAHNRPNKKSQPLLSRWDQTGCPGWDRTSDQVINSHLLCH